jgi:FeS assembly protein IscX
MGRSLTWTTTEDIAIALADKLPDTDPLTVRFTDLFKWVTNLEGFSDDPKNSNEKKLEAIQMAWYEEWQERRE